MNKTVVKYTVIGVLFGCCFPIGAMAFEMFRLGRYIPILELHSMNPLLWMIDSAPLFLGVFASLGGVNQAKAETLINTVENQRNEIQKSLVTTEKSHNMILHIFEKIKGASPELVSYVEELDLTILNIIRGLDQMTDMTSSSIQSISKSMTHTSSKIDESTIHIQDTDNYTKECERLTGIYIEKMHDIESTVTTMNKNFEILRKYSREFDSIINFISKVSSETRLLSLNASVEAAKAGNEGNGFSVIANKIRSMAEDIAGATDNISTQISDMHGLIDTLDVDLDNIVTSVQEGSKLTEDTKSTIERISKQIYSLKDNMNEVTAEIQEQVQCITQISEDSSNITHVTQDIKKQVNDSKEPLQNTMKIMEFLQESMESLVS